MRRGWFWQVLPPTRGGLYISGEAIMARTIPPQPRDITRSQRCVGRLQRIAATVSPQLATEVGAAPLFPGAIVPEPEPAPAPAAAREGADLLLSNACFTPFVGASSPDDTEPTPVIGRVPGVHSRGRVSHQAPISTECAQS
jgi:hypothetical protein